MRVIVLSLFVCACVHVCACMRLSVCLSVHCTLSTVYPKNRCSFELQMWICYELGYLDSKLGFQSREAQESG